MFSEKYRLSKKGQRSLGSGNASVNVERLLRVRDHFTGRLCARS